MRGVNKVTLIGRLGVEPEVKQVNNGGNLCKLVIATSESWKDKTTGDKQERTEWHRVTFFGKLADIAASYLSKGSKVYVEGSLRSEKYTDKDGNARSTITIIGKELQFLDSKSESNTSDIDNSNATPNYNNKPYHAAKPKNFEKQNDAYREFMELDESLPF